MIAVRARHRPWVLAVCLAALAATVAPASASVSSCVFDPATHKVSVSADGQVSIKRSGERIVITAGYKPSVASCPPEVTVNNTDSIEVSGDWSLATIDLRGGPPRPRLLARGGRHP